MFEGLDILTFETYDADGQSFRGPKHWHIFDVVARKNLTTEPAQIWLSTQSHADFHWSSRDFPMA